MTWKLPMYLQSSRKDSAMTQVLPCVTDLPPLQDAGAYVLKHADCHIILTDCQHGFRARRSCETQLVKLLHDLASTLDKGMQTHMVVLDFSKAFDRVLHGRLLRKLYHFDIRGNTHRWISSFLLGRTQRMAIEGCTSDSVPVVSWVPQGPVLGPLLFLLFINDLSDKTKSKTWLFVHYCVVYRSIKDPEDSAVLQQDLHALAKWESKWGMEFHPQKCSVMNVSRARSTIRYPHRLKEHILKTQAVTKYLGVDLQSTLSWKPHIDRISK